MYFQILNRCCFLRAAGDPEITAKLLEAYFCTGDPYWPLDLSEKDEHSILKASVIMAHFLICNQTKEFPEYDEYREKMLDAISRTTPGLLSVMDAETKKCLGDKIECQVYEHICGVNKVWNLQNAAQYIEYSLKNSTSETLKKLWEAASSLLTHDLETLLSSISALCPDKSSYCGFKDRDRRDIHTDHDVGRYVESNVVHSRRKRLYGPLEMMRMFNGVVCNKGIITSLADYWDTHYSRLGYSRVWLMGIASDVWCCLVHNLEKSYEELDW